MRQLKPSPVEATEAPISQNRDSSTLSPVAAKTAPISQNATAHFAKSDRSSHSESDRSSRFGRNHLKTTAALAPGRSAFTPGRSSYSQTATEAPIRNSDRAPVYFDHFQQQGGHGKPDGITGPIPFVELGSTMPLKIDFHLIHPLFRHCQQIP